MKSGKMTSLKEYEKIVDSLSNGPKFTSQILVKSDKDYEELEVVLSELEKKQIIYGLQLSAKQKLMISQITTNFSMAVDSTLYALTPETRKLANLLNRVSRAIVDIYEKDVLSQHIPLIVDLTGKLETYSVLFNSDKDKNEFSDLMRTMLLTNSLDLFKNFDLEYGVPTTTIEKIIYTKILSKIPINFTKYPPELDHFEAYYTNLVKELLLFFLKFYKIITPNAIFSIIDREISIKDEIKKISDVESDVNKEDINRRILESVKERENKGSNGKNLNEVSVQNNGKIKGNVSNEIGVKSGSSQSKSVRSVSYTINSGETIKKKSDSSVSKKSISGNHKRTSTKKKSRKTRTVSKSSGKSKKKVRKPSKKLNSNVSSAKEVKRNKSNESIRAQEDNAQALVKAQQPVVKKKVSRKSQKIQVVSNDNQNSSVNQGEKMNDENEVVSDKDKINQNEVSLPNASEGGEISQQNESNNTKQKKGNSIKSNNNENDNLDTRDLLLGLGDGVNDTGVKESSESSNNSSDEEFDKKLKKFLKQYK
ncbi:MAG: hypothetical protein GWP09_01445 [Nitrospiraceae bacterium]|nr:hypothetical protein [Nitrospiraceae bacterium]